MGKNTMMKRSIRLYCEETGNDQWAPLLDQLVGNVGLVFTKADLSQVGRKGGAGGWLGWTDVEGRERVSGECDVVWVWVCDMNALCSRTWPLLKCCHAF
jgi:hypothetical protein